jgi:hypothetical protein
VLSQYDAVVGIAIEVEGTGVLARLFITVRVPFPETAAKASPLPLSNGGSHRGHTHDGIDSASGVVEEAEKRDG